MPDNELTLDGDHVYRLNGTVIPGVTNVVRGVIPGFEASEYYLQKGRATHHGIRLAYEDRLDFATVDPEIAPRIQAALAFRRDFQAEIVAIEQSLFHPVFKYGGTFDLVLRPRHENYLIVADWKNSISAHVVWQLASYSMLWTANHKAVIKKAVAVELLSTGKYRCKWIQTPELRIAEKEFLALLTTYRILERTGNLKRKENA